MRNNYIQVRSQTYAWYVTFGDLLTLLVCFFLVLTQGVTTESTKHLNKQGFSKHAHYIDNNGIGLANHKKTSNAVGGHFHVVLEQEVHSGQFRKRIADRFENCLSKSDFRGSSVLVSLCRSLLAEDTQSILVVREVYEVISSVRACIGKIQIRFDNICVAEGRIRQDKIGSVEFIMSEISNDRRV